MTWEGAEAEALFQACADASNKEAWAEFVRRFGALIERTAMRISRRWTQSYPQLLDDLMQETYAKLCINDGQILRSYRTGGSGSEFAFLKVLTANVAMDYFRAQSAKRRNSMATLQLSSVVEPAVAIELDRLLILRSVDDCLDRIASGPTRDRDLTVFNLYYKQGFSAQEISQLSAIGLSREGVESLLGRMTRALRSNLRPGGEPVGKHS